MNTQDDAARHLSDAPAYSTPVAWVGKGALEAFKRNDEQGNVPLIAWNESTRDDDVALYTSDGWDAFFKMRRLWAEAKYPGLTKEVQTRSGVAEASEPNILNESPEES